jgi:hypothetical protein
MRVTNDALERALAGLNRQESALRERPGKFNPESSRGHIDEMAWRTLQAS